MASDWDEQIMGEFAPGFVLLEHLAPIVQQKLWPVAASRRTAAKAGGQRPSKWPLPLNRLRAQRSAAESVPMEDCEKEDDAGSNASEQSSGGSNVQLHFDAVDFVQQWQIDDDDDDDDGGGGAAPAAMPDDQVPQHDAVPLLRPPRMFGSRPCAWTTLAGRRGRTNWPKLHHSTAADGTESYLRLSQTANCAWMDIRAVCGRHVNCTRTRSCKSARPLGELWAFLNAAADCVTKAHHSAYVPDYATRLAARRQVAMQPAAQQWLDAEARIPGCTEEPEY